MLSLWRHDSTAADVISSIVDGDATTIPSTTGGDVNMAPSVGEDAALTADDANLDIDGGMMMCSRSFARDITIGSFVLANCFGGYGSSPTSLNLTAESFAFANYSGGHGSSPMSL
ncbi:hypothetical protein GOBAR_DD05725 [Gossypium barbadense]|nr:hypothetical protein GOBAR_DD05725 [Gossypium barbadense]